MGSIEGVNDAPHSCIYYIFHPLSSDLSEREQCDHLIAFSIISVFTACIAPIAFYIVYYTYKGCCSLYGRVEEISDSASTVERVPELHFDNPEREAHYKSLKREIALARQADSPPRNREWLKHGEQTCEWHQNFDGFVRSLLFFKQEEVNPNRILYVQLVGNFSKKDVRILKRTTEFLKVFHRLEVHLLDERFSMKDLKNIRLKQLKTFPSSYKRRHRSILNDSFPRRDEEYSENKQYLADEALEALNSIKATLPPGAHLIAFTSEDLFGENLTNFVFGLAAYGGTGIFSSYRFGNNPTNILLRLMKISAHEFGHNRNLPHCKENACNMGGYMSLEELDLAPLYYCAEDTAKICFLSGISMEKYYQDLLDFYENFNENYDTDIDFSKAITHLQNKLEALYHNT